MKWVICCFLTFTQHFVPSIWCQQLIKLQTVKNWPQLITSNPESPQKSLITCYSLLNPRNISYTENTHTQKKKKQTFLFTLWSSVVNRQTQVIQNLVLSYGGVSSVYFSLTQQVLIKPYTCLLGNCMKDIKSLLSPAAQLNKISAGTTAQVWWVPGGSASFAIKSKANSQPCCCSKTYYVCWCNLLDLHQLPF
jgi:hypothetical protein